MDYASAKEEFINAWGILGSSWGINRTMSQIFALLMITPGKLCVEEIMEELNISRGNASMNLRTLMDWGLVTKKTQRGERREFFETDEDIWALSRQVARMRRKKEIEPILQVLEKVSQVDPSSGPDAEEFQRVTKDLTEVVRTTDKVIGLFIDSEKSWITTSVINFLKKGPSSK